MIVISALGRFIRSSRMLSASMALAVFIFLSLTPSHAATKEGSLLNIDGHLTSKYVGRSASYSDSNYSDHDIYEYLRFDITWPGAGEYEVHFFGIARQDLDGGRNVHDFSPLEDIGSARDSGYTGYVYDAYVALNRPLGPISQLRVGRQAGTRDEPVFFDGFAADLIVIPNVTATIYGGSAVHFEELGHEVGQDSLGGVGVDLSTSFKSVISIDYLNVHDQRGSLGYSSQNNDLYSIKLWQRFDKFMRAMARYRYMNGEGRDLKVSAFGTFVEQDFEVALSYYRQFSRQEELANELSLFYDIVGTTHEYESYDLKLRKFIGAHYAVDLGYYDRGLVYDSDESYFNRDFSRLYASLDIIDRIRKGLTLSLAGERWKTGGNSYWSTGLDAAYMFRWQGKRSRLNAGTYYSLYKDNRYVQLGEREKVQSYYAKVTMPIGRYLTANSRYEYEDGLDKYHTLSFGVRYDF